MSDVFQHRRAAVWRFKPYPRYKDSGVEWLGKIPTSCRLLRLKHSGKFLGGGTPNKDNVEYWSGDIPWVSPKDMKTARITDTQDHITKLALNESATKLVPPDSVLLVVRSGILNHSIPTAINDVEVALNQDLKALVPVATVRPRYLSLLIQGSQEPLLVEWKKEGATVESLELELIANTKCPIPPIEEQDAIISFLDQETDKIDALVAKKERLIELLQEKRTAIITHAVTMGLAPNVPLKQSGLAWLKEIPSHWDARQNGLLFRERDEKGFPNLPVLNVSINSGVTIREFSTYHIEQQSEDRDVYQRAKAGDIAFNKMRMWQGAVGVAPVDGLVSPDYTVAVPRIGVNSRYFEALFRTSSYKTEVNRYSHGIVPDRNRLYWDDFKQIKSLLPPLGEQDAIVEFIGFETVKIDRLISKINEGIERLREYRVALISAAVTGKIDVRDENVG